MFQHLPRIPTTIRIGLLAALFGCCMLSTPLSAQQTPTISQLTHQVRTGDDEARIRAIDQLARYEAAAKEAVPALTEALGDKNRDVRIRAARTLAAIGPESASAVPALTRLLDDQTPLVRAYGAYALGRIGNASKPAVPKLVDLMVDKDATVRRAVINALRNVKESREITIPLMVKVLRESDPEDVLPALHSVAEAGEEAIPFLKEALRHDRACYWACIVAGEMGPAAKELIPGVTGMLDHEEPECKLQALVTLGRMGEEAKSAVPEILELTDHDSLGIRYAAVYALGEIGGGEDVVKALEKSIQSKDPFLRTVSAWSLMQLKPDDEQVARQAATIVIEGLQSDRKDVVSMSIRVLAEMNQVPEDVSNALVEAVDDVDPQIVDQIIRAVADLGEKSVPRIKRALGRESVRGYAVRVMQQMGPTAAPAVPELVEVLRSEDLEPEFRREAHFALGAVGPAAAEAVPVLTEALKHPVPEVRYSASYALGKIGPRAKAANSALKENLRVQDSFLRLGSVWALLQINPDDEQIAREAAPLLAKALDDPRDQIRAEAARSLGAVGKYAQPYREQLQQLLKDADMDVRAAAAEALTKIPG